MSEQATAETTATSIVKSQRMLVCDQRPGEKFTVKQVAEMANLAPSSVKVYVGQKKPIKIGDDQKCEFRWETAQPVIEEKGDELIVIATDPEQMVGAQNALIANLDKKIAGVMAENVEADELIAAAKMAAVDDSAAVRLKTRLKKDLVYLSKVRDALAAGYLIVPDFPGDAVAIRVKRNHARGQSIYGEKWAPRPGREAADSLPSAEGRYVDPVPSHYIRTNTGEKGAAETKDLVIQGLNDLNDESPLSLPMQFMKPTLIKRLGEAMKLKIFDELVLVTGNIESTRGWHPSTIDRDPMIIGRIINNKQGNRSSERKSLAFLIAWFFDTRDI